ncbi:MAG: arginine--tRNA ligase [Flavobacteriales bacterium]|nr:arginine--tRNA ligase [Flavobacteriales bacterium]
MKSIKLFFKTCCKEAIESLYNINIDSLEIQTTRDEFVGHYTLVVFPLIKLLKKNPTILTEEIGKHLIEKHHEFKSYNSVKGFLNVEIDTSVFYDFIKTNYFSKSFGISEKNNQKIMVEYSSPNTNKPLHLGHIRNNLLGFSISRILDASGYEVLKTQIINDRGIHICKSMIAWMLYGNNETPESTGMKGDHFVGKYYVKFDQEYQKQINELVEQGQTKDEAKKNAPILLKAQELLVKWEQNESETRKVWKMMNDWVYSGFNESYKRLGVEFDFIQYESDTYILGKDKVLEGLEKGIFYKKEDNSVWCNLEEDGLDEKLLLRKDGTSVYMTQDIGTAIERIEKYNTDELIYTVGNEQDYHFQVLFLILKKLGYNQNDNLKHLSYGMVDLPEGKMKSREGTVVDADDLMEEMHQTAKTISLELGKLESFNEEEKEELYEQIGIGGLKYFLLKVDPKKRILFNPKESIDFNGNTASFIQYAHARINSLLAKSEETNFDFELGSFNDSEEKILLHLDLFSEIIEKSAKELNPALIANYTFELVKLYNSFYQNCSVLKEENQEIRKQRLALSQLTKTTIKNALYLLGIDAPNRM